MSVEIVSFAVAVKRFGALPLRAPPDADALVVVAETLACEKLRLDTGRIEESLGLARSVTPVVGIVAQELRAGEVFNGEFDFGPFLVVGGDADVGMVDVAGSEVHFGGRLRATAVLAVHNHGGMTCHGHVEAVQLVCDQHALELRGSVSAVLVVGGWSVTVHHPERVAVEHWIGVPREANGKPSKVGSDLLAAWQTLRPELFNWSSWLALPADQREEMAEDVLAYAWLDMQLIGKALRRGESLLHGGGVWGPPA